MSERICYLIGNPDFPLPGIQSVNSDQVRATQAQRNKQCIDRPLHWCKVLSRLLIALAALLTLVSPVTESLVELDNFPRGGQDFELSFFVVLALLCLVLLTAVWGRKRIDRLLGEPVWKPREAWQAGRMPLSALLSDLPVWAPPKQALALEACATPLRI